MAKDLSWARTIFRGDGEDSRQQQRLPVAGQDGVKEKAGHLGRGKGAVREHGYQATVDGATRLSTLRRETALQERPRRARASVVRLRALTFCPGGAHKSVLRGPSNNKIPFEDFLEGVL